MDLAFIHEPGSVKRGLYWILLKASAHVSLPILRRLTWADFFAFFRFTVCQTLILPCDLVSYFNKIDVMGPFLGDGLLGMACLVSYLTEMS